MSQYWCTISDSEEYVPRTAQTMPSAIVAILKTIWSCENRCESAERVGIEEHRKHSHVKLEAASWPSKHWNLFNRFHVSTFLTLKMIKSSSQVTKEPFHVPIFSYEIREEKILLATNSYCNMKSVTWVVFAFFTILRKHKAGIIIAWIRQICAINQHMYRRQTNIYTETKQNKAKKRKNKPKTNIMRCWRKCTIFTKDVD